MRGFLAMGDDAVPFLVDRAFDYRTSTFSQYLAAIFWRVNAQEMRQGACNILSTLRPSYDTLAPLIISKFHSGNKRDRADAIYLMGVIGKDAKRVVPLLLESLKDQDALIRNMSLQSLGKLGPATEAALPQIMDCLSVAELRWQAVNTLRQIGPPAKNALPLLKPLLNETNNRNHLKVAGAICRIDPNDRDCLNTLLKACGTAQPDLTRRDALYYLAELGPIQGSEVISTLRPFLRDESLLIRSQAAHALRQHGTPAKDIITGITPHLEATDPGERIQAAAIILMENPDHELSRQKLIAIVDTGGIHTWQAIEILGNYGITEAIPTLKTATASPDSVISRQAKRALEMTELKQRESRKD